MFIAQERAYLIHTVIQKQIHNATDNHNGVNVDGALCSTRIQISYGNSENPKMQMRTFTIIL
jgi:hypothetical protein